MGSIAELLGYSLVPETEPERVSDEAKTDGISEASSSEDDAREVAMMAVLDESTLDPQAARADLTLKGDLDLDDLGLYAIVTRIEHDLSLSLLDERVESWRTLGELLDDVAAAYGERKK